MSNTSYASTASSSGAVPVVLAIGRLLLAFMFIYAGFGKLTNITGTAGWFGSLGFPVPTLVAILVGLLELVGGLAVLVGFKTRLAAGALAIFTVAATLIAHMDLADQVQQLFFLKNMSITGGLLFVAAAGAGALSIDAKRGH
jgi:Predicted membrane protein